MLQMQTKAPSSIMLTYKQHGKKVTRNTQAIMNFCPLTVTDDENMQPLRPMDFLSSQGYAISPLPIQRKELSTDSHNRDSVELEGRGCWPLARITKLVVQAGNIRAAQLKMSNGHIWERSLNHLYPLELSISQNKQYQVVDPNIELEDNEDEKKLSIRPRFGGRKTMPKS
ncbi:Uncharacterized protein BM_BM10981 [Brugia malayi]|uniref:DUF5641 domain-containing protein n=1 Tax=Brugia malayi TaxID=6279 RepID=A0A4E9EUM7_BRUMA|nr:Uncharacterized protein BM_BM10981 [Brugia malayi]VIO86534.1 Uncharacterized protein BM_BM10981 [Brugia malayi]